VSRQGLDELLRWLLEGCGSDGLQSFDPSCISNMAAGMGSTHEDNASNGVVNGVLLSDLAALQSCMTIGMDVAKSLRCDAGQYVSNDDA
jgi:hypothetical protein